MSRPDESNDQHRSAENATASEASGSNRRLLLLIGLLTLALIALWYDYKVARPSVEQAYQRINVQNAEINSRAEHRLMTSADVQAALQRQPSETFLNGKYTIEAYRWNAGMPIELRGLNGGESPGIGLKTHDYYAVYRKDGPQLAFVTHFKFDLDPEYFVEKPFRAASDNGALAEAGMPGMEGFDAGAPGADTPGAVAPSGDAPAAGPGGGGFDPEAFFSERDADGDGTLSGEEISERMRERLKAIDSDGDGAVSKTEFLAGRSQAGGRGGRGGPGGEGAEAPQDAGTGRQQRPPLEETNVVPSAEAAPSEPASSAAAPAADSQDASVESTPEKPASAAAAESSDEGAKQESGDAP